MSAAGGDLPGVTRLVRLRGPDGTERASRVEGVLDGDLLVLATDLSDPPLGSELVLAWAAGNGIHEVTVRVGEPPASPWLWRLSPVGSLGRRQRRDDVRIPAALVAMLAPVGIPRIGATVLEVSGGGLRCLFRAVNDLEVGDNLTVELEMPDGTLTVPGQVLRLARCEDDGLAEAAIRLDAGPQETNALRAFVAAWQREVLRQGLTL